MLRVAQTDVLETSLRPTASFAVPVHFAARAFQHRLCVGVCRGKWGQASLVWIDVCRCNGRWWVRGATDQSQRQSNSRICTQHPSSCATAIASRLAPTMGRSEHKTHEHPRPPVGASLLAKRPAHPTSTLTEPPLSRASFAPTDLMGVRPGEPGRLSGRLALAFDLVAPR